MKCQLDLFQRTTTHFVVKSFDQAASAPGGVPAAPHHSHTATHSKIKSLMAFVFPQHTSAYLRGVSLLPGDAAAAVGGESCYGEAPDWTENDLQQLLPPFGADTDFVLAKEAHFSLMYWENNASNMNMPTALSKQVQDSGVPLLDCLECLAMCLRNFERHVQIRLVKTAFVPRVIRVARLLELRPLELEAVLYLLVCHCGSSSVFQTISSLMPSAVSRFSKLGPRQLLHFLGESRVHMKQGLICTDQKFKTSFVDSRLGLPIEVIAAFTGESLTDEQLIKLEKTALASVLLAERARGVLSAPAHLPKDSKTAPREETGADAEDLEEDSGSGEDAEESEDGEEQEEDDDEERKGTDVSAPPQKRTRTGEPVSPAPSGLPLADVPQAIDPRFAAPYTTDIEYMDDSFKLIANTVKLRNAEGDMKDDEETFYNVPKNKVEATMRELKGRHRVATAMLRARLEATRAAPPTTLPNGTPWLPRVELLSDKLGLCDFEKQILLLLVGNVISHDIVIAINGRYAMRDGLRELTVGYLLFILCETLQERVQSRKCFYQSAPLISHGIITTSVATSTRTCFNTDLMDYAVDIDRKIVDYLMGTEVETAEMLPGSKLYVPSVPIANVVLPPDTKALVVSTIEHYGLLLKCTERCGFGKDLGCGSTGLVFLFHGPSGTGKTMLANAVAHDLGRKILLVNLLQFKGDAKSPEMLRFVFREAKLNDAIIFFDECESFFETRESNPLVTSLLAEFEKYSGMIILATNRAQIIDEAMNRRISLIIEFKLPSHQMREEIWRSHIPKSLPVSEDVIVSNVALDYELSGGLIRNATLAAISHAIAREKSDTPTLRMEDIVYGAKQQLRGFFQASEKVNAATQSYVTPQRGLDELVAEPAVRAQLESIAKLSKSRNTLFSQWGFSEHECVDQSVICLFYGPSGTGKSLATEGIAYECGATLRVCNIGELFMMHDISIVSVFEEGRKLNAIIVFDQAELLFDHSDKSRSVAQLIQYHAVVYPRPVILLATTGSGISTMTNSIDIQSAKVQLTHEVQFQFPNRALRKVLWRRSLPEKVPLAKDVDFDVLSEQQLSAKAIRSICFNACCKVALQTHDARSSAAEAVVTLKAILDEKEETLSRERRRSHHSSMFA
jgi:SpoVK/Ycf46/Vps4 family AAA+-type ATPase